MAIKKSIAFIGIDGSGKTSIINELISRLNGEGIKSRAVYMGIGRGQKIPLLRTAMRVYSRVKYGKNSEKKGYHHSRDNLRERNVLWLAVQYLELWTRYLLAKRCHRKEILIFDRYFYDGLILGSERGLRIFRYFTPLPSKSFLIKARPETIRKRKDEASVEDIKKYYLNAGKITNYFQIKTIENEGPLKSVTDKIYREILGPYEEMKKEQDNLFKLMNKKEVSYAVLRGYDADSILRKKDLDILVKEEDLKKIKKVLPEIGREIHLYSGEEIHFGIQFVKKSALSERVFDQDKGFFVLSMKDKRRMNFLRLFLKAGRFVKRLLGFYKQK